MAIIIVLATNAGDYDRYVKQVFFDALPREIGDTFVAGSTTGLNSGASFDAFLDRVYAYSHDLWQNASWTDFFVIALAVAVILAGSLAVMLQFAVVLYAKIGLSLALALGPVFIALMLFSSTRPFGEAWIRQLVNFVILQILAVAIIGLFLTTLEAVVQTAAPAAADKAYAAIAIMALLSLGGYVSLQLPAIAGGLAGGGASLTSAVAARLYAGGQVAEGYRALHNSRRSRAWARRLSSKA
jgi:type IV secretion system protein VirB6